MALFFYVFLDFLYHIYVVPGNNVKFSAPDSRGYNSQGLLL